MRFATIAGWTFFTLGCSLLASCATQPPGAPVADQEPYGYMPETATITVGDLKGVLDTDATISWFNASLDQISGVENFPLDDTLQMQGYIKQRVASDFEAKGVTVSPQPGSTRYQLVVAAASGEELTDELHAVFRIYPGLGAVGLNKGAIMVAVLDSVRNLTVWRGAVEGVILDGLSREEHNRRVDDAIDGLLARIEL